MKRRSTRRTVHISEPEYETLLREQETEPGPGSRPEPEPSPSPSLSPSLSPPKKKKEAAPKREPEPPAWEWRGVPYLTLFRIGFYVTMAWTWVVMKRHGPVTTPWERVFAFDHASWAMALSPTTIAGSALIKFGGTLLALASIRSQPAAVVWAALQAYHVNKSVMNAVNHEYLFMLLAILLAGIPPKAKASSLVSVLRWQITVVYMYASVWKFHPQWLDGTICEGIFLGFEKADVGFGVPWAAMFSQEPRLFQYVALCGLALDSTLFLTSAFLPVGHRLHFLAITFHSFTAITMSQRIGMAFPIVMLCAPLLWYTHAPPPGRRGKLFKLVWVGSQLLIPIRGVAFSGLQTHITTMESYRFSWNMMMHSKTSSIRPGMHMSRIFPQCAGKKFPNPMDTPLLSPNEVPYMQMIGMAGNAAVDHYPRTFVNIAAEIAQTVQHMCQNNGRVTVTMLCFTQLNQGAMVRIIDPTVDLREVRNALDARGWGAWLVGVFTDKAPAGHEYFLRGYDPEYVYRTGNEDEIVFRDRATCLQHSPIEFYAVDVTVHLTRAPVPLRISACTRAGACTESVLAVNSPWTSPDGTEITRISIVTDDPTPCGDTRLEDIQFRVKHAESLAGARALRDFMQMQQQQQQQQQQQMQQMMQQQMQQQHSSGRRSRS